MMMLMMMVMMVKIMIMMVVVEIGKPQYFCFVIYQDDGVGGNGDGDDHDDGDTQRLKFQLYWNPEDVFRACFMFLLFARIKQ